jgi:N-acetylneuraminic acid mutarotase
MIIFAEPFAQEGKLQWQVAGKLPSSPKEYAIGVAGAISGIHNDKLFVAGGANFPDTMPWEGGKKKYHNQLFVYDVDSATITIQPSTFLLPEAIAYSAVCNTPYGVFYTGGENEDGISAQSHLISWDTVQSSIFIKKLPSLPITITNASAVFQDEKIIVAGGDANKGTSDQVFMLDLRNTETGWKVLAPLPKPAANGLLFALVVNGKEQLVWMGGRRKTPTGISELYTEVYKLNAGNASWTSLPSLLYPLSAATGCLINPTTILVFGGDRGTTFTKVETLLTAINQEQDPEVKSNLIKAKNHLLINHPGFSKEILQFDVVKEKYIVVGTIPFDTPVTTTAVKWGQTIFISSGEIRAGVRTPNILSIKLND